MSPLVITLLAVVAALIALAFWWIRRNNLAVYPAGRAPLQLQPLPTGCELGAQIMAASAVDTTAAGTAPAGSPGAPGKAPKRKPAESGPDRRTFLRGGLLASWGVVLASFGGASLAFLWPNLRGGFGARIDVATEEEILASIAANREPYPFPNGRMYLVAYDPDLDPDGQYAELTNGASVMALYQRCVHLGCKVPWCQSSQWFECPCHGSRYNRWGEYQFGPAPRGLDRFPLEVVDGRVIVDTGQIITGPTRTTLVLDQPPEGPHCTG